MTDKGIIGSIECFVLGEDFKLYAERLEHFYILNKIDDEKQKIAILASFGGGDLYKVLNKLVAPKKVSECTYKAILERLTAHFQPTRNVIAESFKFYKRDQLQTESIPEYIIELKSLAESCDFDNFLDRALKDKFVCGLSDGKIQQRLLNETKLASFEKACEIALLMETTKNNVELMQTGNINLMGRGKFNKNQGNMDSKFSSSNNAVHNYRKANNNDYKKGNNNNHKANAHKTKQNSDYNGSIVRQHGTERLAEIVCFVCGQKGHFARNCSKRRSGQHNTVHCLDKLDESFDYQYLNSICGASTATNKININGIDFVMEIDTGACSTVMRCEQFVNAFPNKKLNSSEKKFKLLSGESVAVLGSVQVSVKFNGNFHKLELTIVESANKFLPLLGRDWLDVLFENWRAFFIANQNLNKISSVESYKKDIFTRFKTVFSTNWKLAIENCEVDLVLEKNSPNIFSKAYTVPFGLRDAVEDELKRLVDIGILLPVTKSSFASPIVIVKKPNKSIRICVDCKRTINKYVVMDHYPLPIIDDILADLYDCKVFCVLDLTGAYQQLRVSERSQEYLTINTHIGLFRFTRLVFGIKNAPAIFQSKMDEILRGLVKVKCYFDDVCIGGKDLEECKQNLELVLKRFEEHCVRVNRDKCRFLETEISYLGHVIANNTLKPNKEKLVALLNAPQPKNINELQSFLGLVNYYSKFIPNLSAELYPFYGLLRKNVKFEWSNQCNEAFEKFKKLISSNSVLALYNPNKEIILSCDASPYGVGCVLSQIFDSVEKPVMFASSTLSAAEKNYSQTHREALAIIFGVKKFHKYIYGKAFTIRTDHQALKEIFGEKKSPSVAAARLQRWSIFLSMYDYKIEYRRAKELSNADALSRLPIQGITGVEENCLNVLHVKNDLFISTDEIKLATSKDEFLRKILEFVKNGWPQTVEENIKHYFLKRNSLACEDDCLYYGERILIPFTYRKKVLELLHDTHIGVVKMKSLARSYVWWPGIDTDIENWCKCCSSCQSFHSKKSEKELSEWPKTKFPFERVHIDFFTVEKGTFLVVADAYSKWLEVFQMSKTGAMEAIDKLMSLVDVFGYPVEIVSDNGPPFSSKEFHNFWESKRVKVTHSPPYHPQSNGFGEVSVKIAKQALRKMIVDSNLQKVPIKTRLSNFLRKYRNTPSTATGKSPADLVFSFKSRTVFDILNTKSVPSCSVVKAVEKSVCNSAPNNSSKFITNESNFSNCVVKDNVKPVQYNINEVVSFQSVYKNHVNWKPAIIVKKISKSIYIVDINGTSKKAHIRQLRKTNAKSVKYWPGKFVFKHSNGNERLETIDGLVSNFLPKIAVKNFEPMRRSKRVLSTDHRPNYKE